MSSHAYKHPVDVFANIGTGSYENLADYEIVERSFANYTIKLKLDADGRFIDILEVRVSKDFADYKQKIAALGSWDVSAYYDEE